MDQLLLELYKYENVLYDLWKLYKITDEKVIDFFFFGIVGTFRDELKRVWEFILFWIIFFYFSIPSFLIKSNNLFFLNQNHIFTYRFATLFKSIFIFLYTRNICSLTKCNKMGEMDEAYCWGGLNPMILWFSRIMSVRWLEKIYMF